ncbi:PAS domain-containing protein [Fodinicurvata sediminis]|uniref:PAS domain-containing protein n=1 Tax=Fodinicurvata sediminis TaxID=1121832 RepID=UPI0003B3F3C1|nr:PAS domain-containing protein [Fodinicurvata sediminis]
MSTVQDANQITAQRLRDFHAHWKNLCNGAAVAERSAFDIVEAPLDLVGHLILLDVLEGGQDFGYRLVGTKVAEEIGRDFTGETVLQYHARHESREVIDGYAEIVKTGQPHLYQGNLYDLGRDYVTYERLAVPLTDSDGRIAFILACFQFERKSAPLPRST